MQQPPPASGSVRKSLAFAVIGGGIVGGSIAAGLARISGGVALFDEGDVAMRAARGNLGNVWVQGKGMDFPPYADLTRRAAQSWPDFARHLEQETGVDLHYRRTGAIVPFFDTAPARTRYRMLSDLDDRCTVKSEVSLLDPAQIKELITSSLLQIPMVQAMLASHQRVGILERVAFNRFHIRRL